MSHRSCIFGPLDSSDYVRVLAAVLTDEDGRLLVCQRPQHKRHGGLWEFPGGKFEDGESALEAATRELSEELAMDVKAVGEALFKVNDPGSPFVIEFYPVIATGTPQPSEHADLRWVAPDALSSLNLAPSDARFVAFLAIGQAN